MVLHPTTTFQCGGANVTVQYDVSIFPAYLKPLNYSIVSPPPSYLYIYGSSGSLISPTQFPEEGHA